jgi:putative transcriptional regulator
MELFEDLVESLKEAVEISKGTRTPSRKFIVASPEANIAGERLGLAQAEFANPKSIGVKKTKN